VQKVILPLVVAIAILVAGNRASAAIQGTVTLVVNPANRSWQVYVVDNNATANLGIALFGVYVNASVGNVVLDDTGSQTTDSGYYVTAPLTTAPSALGFLTGGDGGIDDAATVNPVTNQASSVGGLTQANGKIIFNVGLPSNAGEGFAGNNGGVFTGYTDPNGTVIGTPLASSSTNNLAGNVAAQFPGYTPSASVLGVEMFQGTYDTAGATITLTTPNMNVYKTTDSTTSLTATSGLTTAYTSSSMAINPTVTLSPVVTPEPASLALLGLGGLALISRRRRA